MANDTGPVPLRCDGGGASVKKLVWKPSETSMRKELDAAHVHRAVGVQVDI